MTLLRVQASGRCFFFFHKRTTLNRKAEGDPSDSDMEDSALAKLWHKESAPTDDVDLLIFRQRDHYVASVHQDWHPEASV